MTGDLRELRRQLREAMLKPGTYAPSDRVMNIRIDAILSQPAVRRLLADVRELDRLRADVLEEADAMDTRLAATGVLLDRCIRPGDRLRAVVADVAGTP